MKLFNTVDSLRIVATEQEILNLACALHESLNALRTKKPILTIGDTFNVISKHEIAGKVKRSQYTILEIQVQHLQTKVE